MQVRFPVRVLVIAALPIAMLTVAVGGASANDEPPVVIAPSPDETRPFDAPQAGRVRPDPTQANAEDAVAPPAAGGASVSPPTARVESVIPQAAGERRVYLPLVATPPTPQREMELEFIRLLNEERVRRGVRPVVEEARLSAYQRDASASLVAETIAAEGLESGCRHQKRYLLLRAFTLREALACNVDTAAEALNGLLNSPPHAGIILNDDADTVGVGVADIPGGAWRGKVLAVTMAVTDIVAPEALRPRALNAVNAHRVALGLAPLTPNAALDRAAQRIAAQTAAQPPRASIDGEWWYIPCSWDDPTALAQAEGYRGRTWTESLCKKNAGFVSRSQIDADLARLLSPPLTPADPWQAAYDAAWRAAGVGVAYAYTDLWPDRLYGNSHTFIIIVLGDDPNG